MRLRSTIRPSRTFVLAFVGFFLMIGAWSIAVPYDGTPDEHDHVYRAVGVVEGEIAPKPEPVLRGSGAMQTVPRGLISPVCWQWQPAGTPADCAGGEPSADATPVRVPSGAGRYQPVFYALVGFPLKWWPGWSGVIIARLISAALSAGLLAGAVGAITRYSRHGLMMGGLVAAATPMLMYFAGSINPNGLEIAAGVAFFAALIPLFTARMERVDPGLLWLAGLSGLLLATLRTTGLEYVPAAVGTFAVTFWTGNVRQLWRSRAAKVWGALIALGLVGNVLWTHVMKTNNLGDFRTGHYTPSQAVFSVIDRWPDLLSQMVGMTSWLVFIRMFAVTYIVWLYTAGGLALFATVFGRWIDRWRLFGVLAGGLLLPTAVQIYYMNRTGFITQGRYWLPMLVGLMLLAANVLEERGFDPLRGRTLTRVMVLALLPIHMVLLTVSMARWQHGVPTKRGVGLGDLNPFVGRWHPPLGSVLPIVLEIAGLVIFGWLAWTAYARRPAEAAPAAAPAADEDTPAEPAPASPNGVAGQRSALPARA